MTWLVLPTLTVFALYFVWVIRPAGLFTADSLFVYLQLLMAVGSLVVINEADPAQRIYGWVLTYTILGYMVASAAIQRVLPAPRDLGESKAGIATFRPQLMTWTLIALSAFVMVGYYQSVGYSALVAGLRNAFAGDANDIATLRLESYSGSQYFFPGLVNQFKNALLPALVMVVITYWWQTGILNRRRIATVVLVGVTAFGLLGTGQRGAFVAVVVTVAVYVYLVNGRRLPRRILWLVVGFAVLMIVSTIALGRSDASLGADPTLWERVSLAATEFAQRVLLVNQTSGVIGFQYIYNFTAVQHGAEWVQSMVSVVPWERPSDIANKIFAYRYGSLRGTSTPSLWASIYYNFGFAGIVVAPLLLAPAIVAFTRRGTRNIDRNPVELIGIAGTFTVIGFWVTGSPLTLLNGGIGVYLLLWWAGAGIRRYGPFWRERLNMSGTQPPGISEPSARPPQLAGRS